MAKIILTHEHALTIAAAIRSRSDDEPTSWGDVCKISKTVTGRQFTRQTLESKESIKEAYRDRAAAFRKRKRTKRKEVIKIGDPKDRRIKALEEEIKELKATLNDYDIKFILLLENTKRLGFRREELEHPLPATS